ncbi:threonine/serine ThrE exporter family protein [Kiloniella laminariae]|uniref:threonine/serine ThrE exporter family protein n=1 Tax=Kiloniella laminariae TaxID=454162 RepID=UPI00037AEA9B|nr:threonine/serine exporter family protein [Kiloniella laminariae]
MNKLKRNDRAFDEACQFIIKLGTAVNGYGPAAARLESFLVRVTESLGYRGVFRSTPSEITFAFWQEGQLWQRTHMVAVPAGGYNMAKLAYVGELVDNLVAGKLTLAKASKRLDEIDALPNPWGVTSYALSFALVGLGFAGLIQGNRWDILFAGLLSLLVYAIAVISERVGGRLADALPFVSAYIAGLCAAALKLFLPEINHTVVTLSAIVILIPGFAVSAGIIEIVDNYVVAGSARLMGGLVYLIKQFTGAWLGIASVGVLWDAAPGTTESTLGDHFIWLYISLLFLGLCVAYQTLWRDVFWVLVSCALSYGAVMISSQLLSANLGALFGAIVAGIFANLWSRATGRPTSIVLIPAITVLVSGSIGFRGLIVAAAGETDKGVDQFMQMFIVALTIAAGLLVSNTILRPKVTL